jgi:hypothetical protein
MATQVDEETLELLGGMLAPSDANGHLESCSQEGNSWCEILGYRPGVSAVADTITELTPNTTYTFELVATDVTLGSAYFLNSPVYGAPALSFKTKGPGKASLASTKLKVMRGRVVVAVNCSTALDCTGGALSITAHSKGKKVACGHATFTVTAGDTKQVTTSTVSAKCKSLLAAAKTHKLSATLTASFDFQPNISKGVTLTTSK